MAYQSYHSKYVSPPPKTIGNMAILPIKTPTKGPAPSFFEDVIDEALSHFKQLIFFTSYQIQSPSDRLLVYLVLYISRCLQQVAEVIRTPFTPGKGSPSRKSQVRQVLGELAQAPFPLPGDAGFPLNSLYLPPATPDQGRTLTTYLTEVRAECGRRLGEKLFQNGGNNGQSNAPEVEEPSKWWMCFAKRNFMGLSLCPKNTAAVKTPPDIAGAGVVSS